MKNLSLDVEESWKQANGKCIIFSPLKNTFRLIEKNWSDHGVQIHHNISKGKGGWLGEKIWPDVVIKACQRSNVALCIEYCKQIKQSHALHDAQTADTYFWWIWNKQQIPNWLSWKRANPFFLSFKNRQMEWRSVKKSIIIASKIRPFEHNFRFRKPIIFQIQLWI